MKRFSLRGKEFALSRSGSGAVISSTERDAQRNLTHFEALLAECDAGDGKTVYEVCVAGVKSRSRQYALDGIAHWQKFLDTYNALDEAVVIDLPAPKNVEPGEVPDVIPGRIE